MRIVAVVPAYNEQNHIGQVVKGCLKYVDTVVVADDCSIDGTSVIAKMAGADVKFSHQYHDDHGAGANVWRGIKYAKSTYKPDVIVLLDGDGQHDPNDIPALLSPVLKGEADAAMGNRLTERDNRPAYRRLSNRIGTCASNVFSNCRVKDAMVGFWAVRADKFPLAITELGWGWSVELLMNLRHERCLIVSVPVNPVWHDDTKENSQSNPVLLGLNLLWKIAEWRIRCRV